MDEENYDTIAAFEKHNWWYRAKRDLFKQILAKQDHEFECALDVGCGVGSNFEILSQFSKKVVGIDYSHKALSYARAKSYASLRKMDATSLQLESGTFDLVICSDVLEHIDDRKAIQEITRVLKPGGLFIFSVPAHNYLWGPTDLISQHKKRYEKEDIRALLAKSFTLKKLSYWNSVMFLPNLLFTRLLRLIGRAQTKKNTLTFIPRFFDTGIYSLLSLENQWFIRFNNLQGVSLVGVAQKNVQSS